uniref:Hemoglobin beta embryonic-3 n=1 Tax=Amphilophus citrinellus TaxID=61819 RepID=A0A3Q0RBY3_AMPCI
MVEWSEKERSIINNIFSNLDYEDVGAKALIRCLIVYPWTQRYFASFGNLYNAEAISANPKVAAHGVKVLHGLDRAVKNMDNIKATYAELNFTSKHLLLLSFNKMISNAFSIPLQLLSDCLTIVIAGKLGSAFTPEVQAAFQKFVAVVVSALGKQYH